jgi:DNA polymerase III delta prime subunit
MYMINTQETIISKYKPYYLNDFMMNEDMLKTLQLLMSINDMNLLFIGPSGSGKTTLLYSIIREYYGLSRNASISETNVLFINQLKDQGIQYYRNEMKTFCQSQCSIYGKKKIIVVDDLDTINEQSQQVFRNYIDKYKNNIHFISVCTNIQKVIESLQSRIHIIQLIPPTKEDIENIMNHIIQKESINIDEPSKNYIIILSCNSIRILINLLEKCYIYREPITLDVCKQLCTSISIQKFEEYFNHLSLGQLQKAITILYELYDYGYSVIDILDYLFNFIKITNSINEETKYKMIPFLCKYITIFNKIHEDSIELAFFTNNIYCEIFSNI